MGADGGKLPEGPAQLTRDFAELRTKEPFSALTALRRCVSQEKMDCLVDRSFGGEWSERLFLEPSDLSLGVLARRRLHEPDAFFQRDFVV